MFKNLIKLGVIILIIIILPILADVISNNISMDMIMKGVYLTSGLIVIHFWKEARYLWVNKNY